MTLTATATYTIVVDPVGSATGSILLTLYDVPTDIAGSITAGGSAETVTTTTEGENGRLSFTGTVGQRVSVKLARDRSARYRWSAPTGRRLIPSASP